MGNPLKIDMHMHVGLLGDQWPNWGHLTDWYRQQIEFRLFLIYARLDELDVNDLSLTDATLRMINDCGLDKVVCLALAPVYDPAGNRRPDLSHIWVDNEYIIQKLRSVFPNKVLLGASVHPYDPQFQDKVNTCVNENAVLLKWLPSAQQIDLASDKAREAMIALATSGPNGRPLPLLIHVGREYAIPSSDKRTTSFDYLRWTWRDKLVNFLRGGSKWHVPDIPKIRENLKAALDNGGIIIFTHCGLPYFTSGLLAKLLEHSDFKPVKEFLKRTQNGEFTGKCLSDVSAICTPFRRRYFQKIEKLPAELLLYGSDVPTPVFELSADLGEMIEDFEAILEGQLYRIVVPEDNLLDVNLRELQLAFPGHPMFSNFSELIDGN